MQCQNQRWVPFDLSGSPDSPDLPGSPDSPSSHNSPAINSAAGMVPTGTSVSAQSPKLLICPICLMPHLSESPDMPDALESPVINFACGMVGAPHQKQ